VVSKCLLKVIVIARVDLNATDSSSCAGIYLSNSNQKVVVRLYTGYDNGRKIFFNLDTASRSILNQSGNIVWLKLERIEHSLTGYYSADGNTWTSLGKSDSSIKLDRTQPNYNSWVGTSVGLFAEGKPADFDFFICKDGYSTLIATGYNNYYGIKTIKKGSEKTITNISSNGGWFMIPGVESGKTGPSSVELTASSVGKGKIEVWLDDLKDGKKITTIPVSATRDENKWMAFSGAVNNLTGHHDVFIKFPKEKESTIFIKSVRFLK
jgi:xylan 1,4-beta-xylosidase